MNWLKREKEGLTKATLVMTEEQFQSLRSQLLQEDRLERAVFLFLGRHRRGETLELYTHKILTPRDGDYRKQHGAVVEPGPQYILKTLDQFQASGVVGYLHAHSHPFSSHARFSGIDDHYLPGEIESLRRYLELLENPLSPLYARLVYGQEEPGYSAECYGLSGEKVGIVEEIRVVGKGGVRIIPSTFAPYRPVFQGCDLPVDRLNRNIRWLGADGQKRVRDTQIVICGAGGIGSALVANARGLGFRKLTLIDPDRVEESNLNRLFGAGRKDIRRLKVKLMKREVKRIDPEADIRAIAVPAEGPEARGAILDGDVIVCGLDNVASRLEVQILAARYLKPLLDLGSGIVLQKGSSRVRYMGAQATFYIPGGPCLLCQGLDVSNVISPEHREMRKALGYIDGTEETPPSVITINSIIAGIAMDMLVKFITGFAPFPIYLRYDLLSHTAQEFTFAKKRGCPVCGHEGVEGKGDEEVEILKPAMIEKALEYSPAEEAKDGSSAQ